MAGHRIYMITSISRFIEKNRRALIALLVLSVMMIIFLIINPQVFLNPLMYKAIFKTLSMFIILASAMVFVIVSGEIDLSFGSIVGLAGWTLVLTLESGLSPYLGVLFALIAGHLSDLSMVSS